MPDESERSCKPINEKNEGDISAIRTTNAKIEKEQNVKIATTDSKITQEIAIRAKKDQEIESSVLWA